MQAFCIKKILKNIFKINFLWKHNKYNNILLNINILLYVIYIYKKVKNIETKEISIIFSR